MNGVTAGDGADLGLVPALFVAVTVNVYGVPFVNPVTVHDSAPVVEHVAPSGDAVTVYPVIGEPPTKVGAVHDTATEPLPATPDTPVGAAGTTNGGTSAPESSTDGVTRIVNEVVSPTVTM